MPKKGGYLIPKSKKYSKSYKTKLKSKKSHTRKPQSFYSEKFRRYSF